VVICDEDAFCRMSHPNCIDRVVWDGNTGVRVFGTQIIKNLDHCRPNWTGNGSGDVESKAINLACRVS
jgi:hypothetical protein